MNSCVESFVWTISFLWNKSPRMQSLGYMVNIGLIFKKLPNYLPEQLYPERSSLSAPLSVFNVVLTFYFSSSNTYMRILSLSSVLSNLFMMCSGIFFVIIFVLEVVELLITVCVCIHKIWKKFGYYLLKYFSVTALFTDSNSLIFGFGSCPRVH